MKGINRAVLSAIMREYRNDLPPAFIRNVEKLLSQRREWHKVTEKMPENSHHSLIWVRRMVLGKVSYSPMTGDALHFAMQMKDANKNVHWTERYVDKAPKFGKS